MHGILSDLTFGIATSFVVADNNIFVISFNNVVCKISIKSLRPNDAYMGQ